VSSPFTVSDFESFAGHHDICITEVNDETTVVVVGRVAWSEKVIDDLIVARRQREGTLRIYSQEMF